VSALTKIQRQFMALARMQCRKGFRNEYHHANWLAKYIDIVDGLPKEERDTVLELHDQAEWDGFSRAQPPAGACK
jgi:hypothetical protein